MVTAQQQPSKTMECDTAQFLRCQRQLDEIALEMGLSPQLHERLRYPKRAMVVSIPVRMDDGKVQLFLYQPKNRRVYTF